MSATKVQVIGGDFSDPDGNPLSNGYLRLQLSQDATVPGVNLLAAGRIVTIQLDANGDAVVSPPQYVWGTDVMLPVNMFYRVTGYSAQGQPVWGPNNQQITGGPTFDLGTWVPNQVFSWTPSPQPLVLETNGTENGSQTLLNLKSGTNISITDDGSGDVTISGSAALTLETNGTPNGSQTLLNLEEGTGVSLTDNGSGQLTVASTLTGLPQSNNNTGDALRWNEYGDSAWDNVIGAPRNAVSYPSGGLVGQAGFPNGPGISVGGTQQAPTATESTFNRWATTAAASANYRLGFNAGSNGSGANFFSLGSTRRTATRLRPSTSSNNIRIWVGMTSDTTNASSWAAEAASSNPNFAYAAFRYAAGTDAHWKAVCATNSSNQTVVDTGVSVDTVNSTLLEIVPVSSSAVRFYINGTLVATVTSNIPSFSTGVQCYWTVDNQNTNNSYNIDWWWTAITFK